MDVDLLTSQLMLIEALFEIATESTDADIVRRAVAGIQSTEAGRAYMARNPLAV
jgi:hypothetical protein